MRSTIAQRCGIVFLVHLAELGDIIEELAEAFLEGAGDWLPHVGSPAADDFTNDLVRRGSDQRSWEATTIETYQSMVFFTAYGLIDHLHGLASVLRGASSFSPMIIGRSVLEAAGRTIWLVDETADLFERVRRGMAIRVRGLQDQLRHGSIVRDLEPNNSTIQDAYDRDARRLADVLLEAHQLRFPIERNKERVIVAMKKMPPTGDGFAHLALSVQSDADVDARLAALLFGHWSGLSHTTYDALRRYLRAGNAISDTMSLGQIDATPEERARAGWWSLLASVHALSCVNNYFGYSMEPLSTVIARNLKTLNAFSAATR